MSSSTEKPITKREDTAETAYTDSSSTTGTEHNSTAGAKLMTDVEAMAKAKEHMRNDQILAAGRLMKQVSSSSNDNDSIAANGEDEAEQEAFRKEVEKKAALMEHVIADLLTDPEEQGDGSDGASGNQKWIKQGESHSDHRDTVMYYQVSEDLQLKCRLETPIESSLLVPLLSVLCETDLYTSWLPKWNVPKIGLGKVERLAQLGRTEQLVQFISEVPWPFTARDVMLQTCACDDIHDIEGDTTGTITIGLISLEEGHTIHKSTVCTPHYQDEKETVVIPPVPEGLKRAEFDGGLLIRKCPEDHVSLQGSIIAYPPDEHLILVGFSMRIDGKISPLFPKTVINFVIQTAISQMWAMFLKIAEDIRAGNRPQHSDVIAAKREEIYDWIDKRIEDMFANLEKGDDASQ